VSSELPKLKEEKVALNESLKTANEKLLALLKGKG
jgi:hypothetical protein